MLPRPNIPRDFCSLKKVVILKLYIYLKVHNSKENPDSFCTVNITLIPKPEDKVNLWPKKDEAIGQSYLCMNIDIKY